MDALKNNLGRNLNISTIFPSKTNPRKRFPDDMLAELAASIKEHGVMQPILVRPIKALKGMDETFEIVAGECRYLASRLANQQTIPAIIRDLDDIEAMKLQVIENIHRTDLHPLEEANGFKQLLETAKWTIDDIIATVGKSRSYVYASLKLTEMCVYAQDAFYDGKLKRETAILIARIPGEKLQTQAVKEITKPNYDGDVMSFRAAQAFLRNRYMLDLLKAPFDTHSTTLCPAAGSCLSCPKRSGNYPELFNDIESADVCTDPNCFSDKKAAHAVLLQESGKKVITGDESEKIAPYGTESYLTGDYCRSDRYVCVAGVQGKYADLLGEDMPEPTILIDKNNNSLEIYEESALKQKLQEKIDSGALVNKPREISPEEVEREAKRQQMIAIARAEKARRLALFRKMHEQLRGVDLYSSSTILMLDFLIEEACEYFYHEDFVAVISLYTDEEINQETFMQDIVSEMSISDKLRLLHELHVVNQVTVGDHWEPSDDDEDPPAFFSSILQSLKLNPAEKLPDTKTASTPPIAAPAKEISAPEKAIEEAKAESHGEISEAEASLLKATDSVAATDEKPLPPAMQRIKDKALAKKAKSVLLAKKQSEAGADVPSKVGTVHLATDATATVENTAQPA